MTPSLSHIYARAGCLKDEVLKGWIDNLSHHAMSGTPEMKVEALRRIDYIERELLP